MRWDMQNVIYNTWLDRARGCSAGEHLSPASSSRTTVSQMRGCEGRALCGFSSVTACSPLWLPSCLSQ